MKVKNCSCTHMVGGRVIATSGTSGTSGTKRKSKATVLQFGKLKKTDDERVADFLEKKKTDLEKHEASKIYDSMKHPDIQTLVGSIKYGTIVGSQTFPGISKGTRTNYAIVIEYLPRDSSVEYQLVEYSYVDRKSKDHIHLNVRFVDDEYKGVPKRVYDQLFKRLGPFEGASIKMSSEEMSALEALKLVRIREEADVLVKYLDYTNVDSITAHDIKYGYFNLAKGAHEVTITNNKKQLKLLDSQIKDVPKKKIEVEVVSDDEVKTDDKIVKDLDDFLNSPVPQNPSNIPEPVAPEPVIDDDGDPEMAESLDFIVDSIKSGKDFANEWVGFCNHYKVSIQLDYRYPGEGKMFKFILDDPFYDGKLPIYIPFDNGKYFEYSKGTFTKAFNKFNKREIMDTVSLNIFKKLGLVYPHTNGNDYVLFYRPLSTVPNIKVQYQAVEGENKAFSVDALMIGTSKNK